MNNRFFGNIRESLYTGSLENGLTVHILPQPGFMRSFAMFATNYGGAMRRFELDGRVMDTPAGVAHFLEHKMFDLPDGQNALSLLSANGASPNAWTSNGMTAYHFSSTQGFEDHLRTLLTFVSTPYFTPESVAKEQGIIGQEIRMTEDSPGFSVYVNLMRSLYAHNPVRDSVIGTVESISQISDKTLYDCHKAFYAPSNMVLCVAGGSDPDTIVSIARELLPKEAAPIPKPDFGPVEGPLRKTLEPKRPWKSRRLIMLGAKLVPPKTAKPCCVRSSPASWPPLSYGPLLGLLYRAVCRRSPEERLFNGGGLFRRYRFDPCRRRKRRSRKGARAAECRDRKSLEKRHRQSGFRADDTCRLRHEAP
jgi:predicted Zn-dependent peptidase